MIKGHQDDIGTAKPGTKMGESVAAIQSLEKSETHLPGDLLLPAYLFTSTTAVSAAVSATPTSQSKDTCQHVKNS